MPHPIATAAKRMTLVEALEVLRAVRRDEVVVTTMGNAREWQKLGKNALDLIYVPSSMGQGTSLALGIALAQARSQGRRLQRRRFDVDELGLAGDDQCPGAGQPHVIVFDNGVYEVTGAQPTAAAPALRPILHRSILPRWPGPRDSRGSSVRPSSAWQTAVPKSSAARADVRALRVEPVVDAGLPGFPGPAPDRCGLQATARVYLLSHYAGGIRE